MSVYMNPSTDKSDDRQKNKKQIHIQNNCNVQNKYLFYLLFEE